MDIRNKIITACRSLSQERGLHNINMDELAARAGVSKRTVYRYFTGKEAIIEATLDSFMAGVAEEVTRLLQNEADPLQILSSLQKYLFVQGQFMINPQSFNDLKQYYPCLWQKIEGFRLKQVQSILSVITTNYKGTLMNDIDPRIVSAVIISSIQTVLNPEFVISNNLAFEETARQLSNLFLYGFIPR